VIVGIPAEQESPLKLWDAMQRELTITIQKRSNGNDHDALDLLAAGRLDANSIITHRFSLDRGAEAFETMGTYADGIVKPVIEF
jgi:threonine dehydrogenase-like Zn-dependent dehydrogenase